MLTLETRIYTTTDQRAHNAVRKLAKCALCSFFIKNRFVTFSIEDGRKEYTYDQLLELEKNEQ